MTATVPPVRVREAAFDPGAELNRFVGGRTDVGAIVTFTGVVRSNSGDPIASMTLEHYQELAEASLAALVAEVRERFQLGDVMVIHRFGRLLPGEGAQGSTWVEAKADDDRAQTRWDAESSQARRV